MLTQMEAIYLIASWRSFKVPMKRNFQNDEEWRFFYCDSIQELHILILVMMSP